MLQNVKESIADNGFAVVDNVFTVEEMTRILAAIEAVDKSGPTFRKSKDLFAIRQFFKEVPEAVRIVFNARLQSIINDLFGTAYFVVKSIYFDKPPAPNWFVAYHQDLTISVDKKQEVDGYGPWTVKQDQFAVQPPLSVLEDNFTVRIHLDKTTRENGALKVIPGSHGKGIYRAESIDWSVESECICEVEKGGVMFMKPLLLHASGRSTNDERRRVIHVEFSRQQLAVDLKWAERPNYD